MKRFWSFGRVLLIASVLVWEGGARAAEGPAGDAGPRIVFEKEVVNAGDVVRGTTADYTFVVRNTGTEVLKILSAKPG